MEPVVDRARRRVGRQAACIVLAGGAPVCPPLPRLLPAGAHVIAADSGLAAARPLGLEVDLIVGDLDSVDAEDLAAARRAGIPVERHPVDKDRTDLAIALDVARGLGARQVVVVGGDGGRLDHLLAGALLLAAPDYRSLAITALMGSAVLTVVHDEAELTGRPGDTVSLIAVHGEALGVRTRGLRFALDDEALPPGSSRGVSNVLTRATATIGLRAGVLIAVQPGDGDLPHPLPESEGRQ